MELDHASYSDALEVEIDRLADVVDSADANLTVPGCPGWTVADLVGHIGSIHRWAGHMVEVLSPKRVARDEMDMDLPPGPADYPRWLRDGGRSLLIALRAADPDASMWAWGADQHVRFWSRRMLHETTVHRADAELAAGLEPSIEQWVAVDGVDELLTNLPSAARFRPRVAELSGTGETLLFGCEDAPGRWRITLEPTGFAWQNSDGDADVSVSGKAVDLELLAYGRRAADDARFSIAGDRALLARWLEHSSL